MPCRVSSDVHEWTNEGPAVPIYDPANHVSVDEQSSEPPSGREVPVGFTAACCCDMVWPQSVVGSHRSPSLGRRGVDDVTPVTCYCVANPFLREDIGRWAVRLGGTLLKRYRGGPKGWLNGSELRR